MNSEPVKTVAVIGASTSRAKFGNKAVRAYAAEGWNVLPINPKAEQVEGLSASASITEITEPIDRITVYLPPALTLRILPELAAADAREVWFNPGSADDAVLAAASELGIPARDACSIVDIGRSPSEFP